MGGLFKTIGKLDPITTKITGKVAEKLDAPFLDPQNTFKKTEAQKIIKSNRTPSLTSIDSPPVAGLDASNKLLGN